jgi:AICAR transformylase/IMP cyclohydrolase PurH
LIEIRASAKCFKDVIVVCDPNDYDWIAERIQSKGLSAISIEVNIITS